MKIIRETEIYSDKNYCESSPSGDDHKKCKHLNDAESKCHEYDEGLSVDHDSERFLKCDQCKDMIKNGGHNKWGL